MIAVSLAHVRHISVANRNGADLLELRTDYFTDRQLRNVVQRSRLPIIYTVKRQTKYLPKVQYIDFDYTQARRIPGVKVIASYHDYSTTPPYARLERLTQSLLTHGFIPKIATLVTTVDHLYTIARLQQKFGKKIIAIGMGELGIMTRIYNRSLLTYAAASNRNSTAPGQLTIAQLRTAKVFGLIGDDIQHSRSPQLHKQYYRQHHLPYYYQLWETSDFAKMMFVFNFFKLPGASITKPFKRAVMPYCDHINHHAKTIGAVNTLLREGKQLVGYNTDWIGVQKSIGRYLTGKKVRILGKGGAGKAVAYAVRRCHGRVVFDDMFDVLVNATPVTDHLLVPAETLRGKVVMDCIYGKKTALLQEAKRHGARVVLDGLPMLRYQAREQFMLTHRYKTGG